MLAAMEIDAAALDGPTIGQVSDRVGLSPDTLRWYERIGLLEAVPRDAAGQRRYRPLDLDRLELLIKMRATGMPLTEMHDYVALIHAGPASRRDRLTLLETHRQRTLDRMAALQRDLVVIDRKIDRYRNLLEHDDAQHHPG